MSKTWENKHLHIDTPERFEITQQIDKRKKKKSAKQKYPPRIAKKLPEHFTQTINDELCKAYVVSSGARAGYDTRSSFLSGV